LAKLRIVHGESGSIYPLLASAGSQEARQWRSWVGQNEGFWLSRVAGYGIKRRSIETINHTYTDTWIRVLEQGK